MIVGVQKKGVQRKVKIGSIDSDGRCDRGLYLSETYEIEKDLAGSL